MVKKKRKKKWRRRKRKIQKLKKLKFSSIIENSNFAHRKLTS
jgi:hypothetical protein